MTKFGGDSSPFTDFGITGHIIPSGVHYETKSDVLSNCTSLNIPHWDELIGADTVRIELCNPMARTKAKAEVTDVIAAQKADLYRRSGNAASKELVRLDDITSYGELLAQAAYWLSTDPCDGVIVPLRGGIVPSRQIDVMKEYKLEPLLLPFTQGANKKDYEQCRHELAQYLSGRLTEEYARVVIIDTADGGNGSVALAELLTDVHSDLFPNVRLCADFLLFFDVQGNNSWFPPESRDICRFSNDKLHLRVVGCRTTSLITESWDEALGLNAGWNEDGTPRIIAAPFAGKVLVQDRNGGIYEYDVERMDQFVTDLLASEVSDAVRTTDGLRFECDVWEKYGEQPE